MGALSCPIISCPLYKRGTCKSSTEHVSIHRFPISNVKLRKLWEDFVSGQNGTPFQCEKKHGLCTAHFAAKFMMPSGRITRDAVPSIAPVSTKKVFCKWNIDNSRLTPIPSWELPVPVTQEVAPTPTPTLIEADSESVSAAESVVMDDCVDNDDNADDGDDLGSAGEINFVQDFGITPDSVCPPTALNPIYTLGEEVLDTVEKVENAIKVEKEEALKRYQASVQRVRNLKILLNQLKESAPVEVAPSTSPLKKLPPKSRVSSTVKPPVPIYVPPASFIVPTSMGDNGLPPPLFDDYN